MIYSPFKICPLVDAPKMKLTAKQVEAAKPKEKAYKLADGAGMYLEVSPSGSKYWRLKYRIGGKEKRLALGVYPAVTLAEAREKRDEAKRLHAGGGDPSALKKARKKAQKEAVQNSFESVAREWHEHKSHEWSVRYREDVIEALEKDIFPYIGNRPISEIEPPELLEVLRKIETRGALETLKKIRRRTGEVFKYAIGTGKARYNPAADLDTVLKKNKGSHHAFLPVEELPEFLRDLSAYTGSTITKIATRLLMLTGLRTQELRFSR